MRQRWNKICYVEWELVIILENIELKSHVITPDIPNYPTHALLVNDSRNDYMLNALASEDNQYSMLACHNVLE